MRDGKQLHAPTDLTPGVYFLHPWKVGCMGLKTSLDVWEFPALVSMTPVGNQKAIHISPARSPVTVSTALPRLAIFIQIKANNLVQNHAEAESCGEDTSELWLIRLKSRQRFFQKLIFRQLGKAFSTFYEI
jgi:hypothetical protein